MQWMKEWAREQCTKLFLSLQLLFVLVFYKYSSSSICLNESWGSPEFSFRHREDNILLPKPCKLRCIHFLCLLSEGRILLQKLEWLMSFSQIKLFRYILSGISEIFLIYVLRLSAWHAGSFNVRGTVHCWILIP